MTPILLTKTEIRLRKFSDLPKVSELGREKSRDLKPNVVRHGFGHFSLPLILLFCWPGLALPNSLASSGNTRPPSITENQPWGSSFCSLTALSAAVPLNGMFFPEIFLRLLLLVSEISAQSHHPHMTYEGNRDLIYWPYLQNMSILGKALCQVLTSAGNLTNIYLVPNTCQTELMFAST